MHHRRARRRSALGVGAALAFTSAVSVIAITSPASGDTGVGVSYDKAGCRNDGTVILPNSNGDFICEDADYTSGNLGKGWNELDLVPFRATVTAGNSAPASQTVTFVIAVDNMDAGKTGYDFLSVPVLNTDLSSGGCGTLNVSGQQFASPGMGSADITLYRTLTITGLQQGATCVYDHFARLALGSHLYPGASLHWNLANDQLGTSGIGSKEISIPVNEILPQQLDKTMGAVRDADFTWLLAKNATPANLGFADTCDPAAPRTASVTINLSWTKQAATASGYTITTVVTATNPAARVITVNPTDRIYAGGSTDANGVHTGGVLLDTAVGSAVDVPANSSLTVLTHVFSITPAQLTALGVDPNAPDFNDVATATYTDKVTGIPVPGSTFAAASIANADIGSGTISGNSIVVTDSESITGAGLDFSVATPSVGSFTGGYVAGTFTTGPVAWTSGTQTSSGSVTFNKTVRVTAATATSGTLSDSASGAFGNSTATAGASTSITSNALVDLTIHKRRSPVTNEAQTFNFDVKNSANAIVASPSITVPGGTAANVDTSTTVNNLPPGTYAVDEAATGPYPAQSANATINLPSCSGSVSFTNSAAPAGARVEKITVPGGATVWDFTLSGPDVGASGTETIPVTANTGFAGFTSALNTDGATYTITETAKVGWDPTTIAGDFGGVPARATTNVGSRTCSFTLDLPADSGGVFSCSFTNTQRGALKVRKTVIANDSTSSLTDTFTICITGPSYPAPTVQNGGCQTTGISGGDLTWTNLLPGSYTVSEAAPGSPWIVGINPVSVNVAAGSTASAVASTVTNTRKGRVRVVKTVSSHDGSNPQAPAGTESFAFQLRTGTTDILGNPGSLLESGVANAGNNGQFAFSTLLTPGQVYQVCETGIDPAWAVQLSPGPQFVPEQWTDATRTVLNPNVINDTYCVNFTAQPGPDPTVITVNNFRPPEGFALTIGYWKNHASCSGSKGGQDATLDQVLASLPIASGQTTHGVWVGDVYVDTCLEAVRLLNKSTINSNKKFASDPLFNLAAQLLAARLNVQAGAGTCAAAINAINAGQALLDQYNFTGTATVKLKSSQVAGANSVARSLDFYNNNLLC